MQLGIAPARKPRNYEHEGGINKIYEPVPGIGHPTKIIEALVYPQEELENEVNTEEDPRQRSPM